MSTATSCFSANAVIETDYSLGNFTGHMGKGVPSNLAADGSPYYNTQRLPFQTARLGFGKLRMGGCAGCHDAAAGLAMTSASRWGNNVTQPEHTNALGTPNRLRSYFPPR